MKTTEVIEKENSDLMRKITNVLPKDSDISISISREDSKEPKIEINANIKKENGASYLGTNNNFSEKMKEMREARRKFMEDFNKNCEIQSKQMDERLKKFSGGFGKDLSEDNFFKTSFSQHSFSSQNTKEERYTANTVSPTYQNVREKKYATNITSPTYQSFKEEMYTANTTNSKNINSNSGKLSNELNSNENQDICQKISEHVFRDGKIDCSNLSKIFSNYHISITATVDKAGNKEVLRKSVVVDKENFRV